MGNLKFSSLSLTFYSPSKNGRRSQIQKALEYGTKLYGLWCHLNYFYKQV